jgi:uncharacterized protein DUF2130
MSLDPINARAGERHTHKSGSISVDEPVCPTCDQPISQEKFEEIQVRIEGEERARAAKIERTLQARFTDEMAKVEAIKKAEVEKARKDAAAQIEKAKREAAKTAKAALAPKLAEAEKQIKSLKADQQAVIDQRLQVQREALDKAKAKAVSDEKAKAYEERLRLEEKLQELTRQLQKKTAHELGEPAEFDLYETLRAEFHGDQISRVAKGVKGPDIILEVVHNGVVAGSIVIDCKNHKRWQSVFTKKVRTDQLALGADFGILSSSTFPKGARQLHIADHILIADPARVTVLVHLLRRQIIQNHVLKLGSEGRNEKASRLLAFIISPVCTDLLDRIVKLTEELVAVDVKEASSHEATWRKRGELIRGIRGVHDSFAEAIDRIIGTTGSGASS